MTGTRRELLVALGGAGEGAINISDYYFGVIKWNIDT